MFKVNNRSKRRSGVCIVKFEYIWHISNVFYADFEHVNAGQNTLLSVPKCIYLF